MGGRSGPLSLVWLSTVAKPHTPHTHCNPWRVGLEPVLPVCWRLLTMTAAHVQHSHTASPIPCHRENTDAASPFPPPP